MLFETKVYWLKSDIEFQTKCWEILKTNYADLIIDYKIVFPCFLSIMTAMYDPKQGYCCPHGLEDTDKNKLSSSIDSAIAIRNQSLDTRYDNIIKFMTTIVQNMQSEYIQEAISSIILKFEKKNLCHCLFKAYVELFSMLSKGTKFDPLLTYSAIFRASSGFSIAFQLQTITILKETLANSEFKEEDLYNLAWKYNWCKSEKLIRPKKLTQENNQLFNQNNDDASLGASKKQEDKEDHMHTSTLQEKVLSEEANINSTIKRIKQIQIDIQEANKIKSEGEEKKTSTKNMDLLGTDLGVDMEKYFYQDEQHSTKNTQQQHILSIDELIAHDQYKPPPAPKHERMKAKKFVFGDQDDAPEEKKEIAQSVKPKFPVEEKKEKAKEPQVAKQKIPIVGFAAKAKLRGLAIDTDNINKEFDIGGEKGKKLVNEKEEEIKYEQEILELAEHCVIAMERSTPNDPIHSKYSSSNKTLGILSVPITTTHKGTLMQSQKKPFLFPQSTKERKQFTFHLDSQEAMASTPIKEESLITSKSSVTHEMFTQNELLGLESAKSERNSELDLLCSSLLRSLVGDANTGDMQADLSQHQILDSSVLGILLKLGRKAINSTTLSGISSNLLKIAKFSEENRKLMRSSEKFMKNLLKLSQELYIALCKEINKAKNVVVFEEVINLHAILNDMNSDSEATKILERSLLKWICGCHRIQRATPTAKSFEPELVSDCLKYLWGKELTEAKMKVSNKDRINESSIKENAASIAEMSFLLLVATNETEKERGLVFSNVSKLKICLILL